MNSYFTRKVFLKIFYPNDILGLCHAYRESIMESLLEGGPAISFTVYADTLPIRVASIGR